MSSPTTADPSSNNNDVESRGRLPQSPNIEATMNSRIDATTIRSRVNLGPPSSLLGDAAINPLTDQQNAAASAATWKGSADIT